MEKYYNNEKKKEKKPYKIIFVFDRRNREETNPVT